MSATVHGRVDPDGRLISADPALLGLHMRAGGAADGPLAVPQLASIARLARTLGILVSRSVIAADGEQDLDLIVRAQPDGRDVTLAIGGWAERAPIGPRFGAAAGEAATAAGLRWECDAALRLTRIGGGDAALIGQPLTRWLRLAETEDGEMPILEALARGARFSGQPAEARDTPGLRVMLSGVPVRDTEGRFAGFRGIAARLDDERAEAEGEPQPDIAVGSAFAQRLDGALRGPLKRIIAGADSISAQDEGPLRHDYANYAGDIASAGRHLLGLVDDLVDLQAIEREDFAVETEAVDLADIARRAAGLLGVRAADRGIRIDRPGEDEALLATGDFRRALQILVNLVGNAVRYSPEGAQVWIRTEREGDLAAVIVADQGRGIAAEDHERIFAKFERLDATEAGGSGLGLYIARRLARAMGGDIAVDSAPGQGARFVLTLPAG